MWHDFVDNYEKTDVVDIYMLHCIVEVCLTDLVDIYT